MSDVQDCYSTEQTGPTSKQSAKIQTINSKMKLSTHDVENASIKIMTHFQWIEWRKLVVFEWVFIVCSVDCENVKQQKHECKNGELKTTLFHICQCHCEQFEQIFYYFQHLHFPSSGLQYDKKVSEGVEMGKISNQTWISCKTGSSHNRPTNKGYNYYFFSLFVSLVRYFAMLLVSFR